MIYRVGVLAVGWGEKENLPFITWRKPIATITVTTETETEVELLYILANPSIASNPLWELLSRKDDGQYMLVVAKHSPISNVYKYEGYAIVSKRRDVIFWDTKHFQIGDLNVYNITPRDIVEEVKRRNWRDIPGGETTTEGLPTSDYAKKLYEEIKDARTNKPSRDTHGNQNVISA